MRFLLSLVGVLVALAFMAAAGSMAWHFNSAQGASTAEGQILGAVSVANSVLVALLPFFIVWGRQERRWLHTIVGTLAFVLCFGWSLFSAAGFAASSRGAVTGGREALALRLQVASGELAEAEAKFKAHGVVRAAPVIEEALARARQDKRWSSSKECTEATAEASRTFCREVGDLRVELAASVEADRLSRKLEALRGEIRTLRERGAGQDKDPQAGMLARLTGIEVSQAQLVWIVFAAVLVEFGAAFGLFLALGHYGLRLHGAPAPPTRMQVHAEVIEPVADVDTGDTVPRRQPRRLEKSASGTWLVRA